MIVIEVTAASMSSSSRHTSSAEFLKEQIKYQNLPSTVFAPSGRLHQVDFCHSKSMDVRDEQSSLCVAILCQNGTSVVLVTTSPMSPYCDLEYLIMPSSSSSTLSVSPSITSDQHDNETTNPSNLEHYNNYTAPLLLAIKDATTTTSHLRTSFASLAKLNSLPFCVVGSSSLLIANGGNSIQSHIIETKVQEIVLGLFQEEQCSLQRAIPTSLVARYLSDVNQIPTQSLVDEDHTQMLSCSTLLVGWDDDNDNDQQPQPSNGGNQRLRLPCIWKVDSTGRYTKCDMAAVGRGANVVETCLIKHVLHSKLGIKEENDEDDDDDDSPPHENDLSLMEIVNDGYITNQDVQQYCNSLSTKDALVVAQRCILDVLRTHSAATSTKIMSMEEEEGLSSSSSDNTTERRKMSTRMFQPRTWGLLHGVVMEPNSNTNKLSPASTTSNIANRTRQQQRYKRNESPFILRYFSEGDLTKLATTS